MTALEQLGAFVAHSGVPSPRLREILELHVVDIVGAWIASLPTPEGAALLRWRAASGEGAAPGSIHRLRLDVATHCALARLSEIDDIHLASTTTPGAIVVPGAVAIAAAHRDRDPAALAAAMMAGYEVMVRFGQAIDGPSILYRGIWPTYLAAPLGIAAVAARLLGLDARQTAHALALAVARSAPGVGHHNAATTSRRLHVRSRPAGRRISARHLRREAGPGGPDGGTRRAVRARRGLVQAVVCGAPDHGGDPSHDRDHRIGSCGQHHHAGEGIRA